MIRRSVRLLSAICIAASLLSTQGVARDKRIKIRWDELSAAAGRGVVSLMLPGGALLEGTVTEVRVDAMVLQVRKSSVPAHREGQQVVVPRDSVKVVQTTETKGPWRALGAIAGAAGGVLAGWTVAEGVFHTSGEGQGVLRESGGVASVFGIGAGGALAGYAIGRKADRDTVYFEIAP